jgi:hypothetical protein
MKRLFPVCLALWLGGACLCAGPAESAIVAMMRLSDQPNYAWVATVSDDARTYDIHGRTARGGFTLVKMPVVNSVRRQLGRSVTDTHVEMIFRGNVACVIATEDGWKKPDELPPPESGEVDLLAPPGSPGHPALLGVPSSKVRVIHGSILPRGSRRQNASERAYSNLQLAISHPHEDLGVIVVSHQQLQVEGDVVTGVLTDLGAQLLLVRDGQEAITPLRASGTFKLWLRNGQVAKYQVRLEGTLNVDTPSGRRQINVQQVSDTVLKDIGTTTFDVPQQARLKLGG